MPKPSSENPRTTQIPIKKVPVFGEDQLPATDLAKQSSDQNFTLNIDPAYSASESVKVKSKTDISAAESSPAKKIFSKFKEFKKENLTQNKINVKVWSWLEWLVTSAAIFILLFFVLNWGSYSMLFKSKLDQLKGQVQNNPYIEELTSKNQHPASNDAKPLPIVNNTEVAKKQIPSINLTIAPPDDRIIVERISQNVPIVRVSTEKLIQKDWGALEKEIQEALQGGVVHYPGTLWPGDKGNVVLTGHSSYFPWDPGRFKDVFALLTQINIGDKVIVYHDQKAYTYQVYDKQIVTPDYVEVLAPTDEERLTLITCYPVGTNQKRLVVFAKPI